MIQEIIQMHCLIPADQFQERLAQLAQKILRGSLVIQLVKQVYSIGARLNLTNITNLIEYNGLSTIQTYFFTKR